MKKQKRMSNDVYFLTDLFNNLLSYSIKQESEELPINLGLIYQNIATYQNNEALIK